MRLFVTVPRFIERTVVSAVCHEQPLQVFSILTSGAYFWRNYSLATAALGAPCGLPPTSYCVGFGFPGSANTNNKDYQEATLGFVPTLWSGPNYGKL